MTTAQGNSPSVVIQRQPNTLATLLQKQKTAIEAALPRHMNADRLMRIALTEVRKNPQLAQCEPLSFIGAVVQAAQLGLEPGSALGHAYLVPRNNRKRGVKEATLIIGYRGMLDLARRSGQIISITANAVYDCDTFEFALGLDEKLHHVPVMPRPKGSVLTHVYAIARLRDGGHQIQLMSRDEIDSIKKRSQSSDDGPWVTDFEEMARKTVLRKLFKYLPVSIELQRAVTLDEEASSGLSQRNELVLMELDDSQKESEGVLSGLGERILAGDDSSE